MVTDKTQYYVQQQRLSFVQFLAELPNFLAVTVSAVLTGSLLVWLDFLDSLGNVLRTGAVTAITWRLSVDPHRRSPCDANRIENTAVLFCDGLVMCGLMTCAALSVYEILVPHRPSELLVYVVVLKVVNVIFDGIFLFKQAGIRKMDQGMLAQSNYTTAFGMLLFDVEGMVSLMLISMFRDSLWVWYFSPIISLLITAYLACKCASRLRGAVGQLCGGTTN